MKSTVLRILALAISVCMIFTLAACGNGNTESTAAEDDNILYGNAVDDAEEDDAIPQDGDLIVGSEEDNTSSGGKTSSGSKTSSGNKGSTSSSSKGSSTTSYSSNVGKVESTYEVDEDAKEKFFESVPKSLKGQTVRVLIWWEPGVTESKKAEVFEKETGIKIKFVTCGAGDAYYTKLSALIGQDNAPDLACITQSNFPSAIIQNYFEPLSVGKLDLKDSIYDIDTMNYFKWDNKYYGAMVKSSTMITFYCAYYNKDLYKGMETPYDLWQAGKWNWDTLVSSTQSVMKANKSLKAGIVGDYSCHFFAQTSGSDLVEFNNGKIVNNCNDTNILKGYQMLSKLRNDYEILSTGSNYQYFYAGQAAMAFTGNYLMQTGDGIDENVKFNWGVVPLPCPAGQETVVPSSVKMWGFPRGAEKTEAASYWLRYWLDESFDEEGYNLWTNDEAKTFNNWLWEQDKQFINWTGIIEADGETKSDSVIAALVGADSSSMKSVIDTWSSKIDSNSKLIMARK